MGRHDATIKYYFVDGSAPSRLARSSCQQLKVMYGSKQIAAVTSGILCDMPHGSRTKCGRRIRSKIYLHVWRVHRATSTSPQAIRLRRSSWLRLETCLTCSSQDFARRCLHPVPRSKACVCEHAHIVRASDHLSTGRLPSVSEYQYGRTPGLEDGALLRPLERVLLVIILYSCSAELTQVVIGGELGWRADSAGCFRRHELA